MNVLLVDDHALFREGLALLLRPLTLGGTVHEAGTCEQAQDILGCHSDIELVLMDLGLPGMSGLDGIAWLQDVRPGLPVIALSSADDRQTVLNALDAGAMGFIPKSSSSTVMMAALQVVLANGIYLPPAVFLARGQGGHLSVVDNMASTNFTRAQQAGPKGTPRPSDLGLTSRQADVLDLLLQGKSTKLICRELDLALGTVKSHTSAVLRALNVTTRTQAVIAASRIGWRITR